MVAERCFPVIPSRLKDHDHITFAIFDESILFEFDGQIGAHIAHTCSMVARHAKFECFPWIRLDTAHALLERSYAAFMPMGRFALSSPKDRKIVPKRPKKLGGALVPTHFHDFFSNLYQKTFFLSFFLLSNGTRLVTAERAHAK